MVWSPRLEIDGWLPFHFTVALPLHPLWMDEGLGKVEFIISTV